MRRIPIALVALALMVGALAPVPAAAASIYSLQVSQSATRSAPVPLDGASVTGNVNVFVSPATGLLRVQFYLDNPSATGTAVKTENSGPWDLAGTATNGNALPFNASALSPGAHTLTIVVTPSAGAVETVTAAFTVTGTPPPPPTGSYALSVSTSPDRSAANPLQGSTLTGQVYVFLGPATGITRVRFFLDNPTATGTPTKTEGAAAYDLAGTASNGTALPYNANTLTAGQHSLTAAVDKSAGGTDLVTATFTVGGGATPTMSLTPASLTVNGTLGGSPATATTALAATSGTPAFTVTDNQPWLTVTPTTGSGAASLTVTAAPGSLAVGTYTGTVTVSAPGYASTSASVSFVIADPGGCTPVACSLIKVARPFSLGFTESSAGIVDGLGQGTGLTTYIRRADGGGYVPSALSMDTLGGGLRIATTPGGTNTTTNNQDNMLGVGFDGTAPTVLESKLPTLPPNAAGFAQAGTWFGYSQNEVVRVAVVSLADGWRFEHTVESAGVQTFKQQTGTLVIPTNTEVFTRITTNPSAGTITAAYRVGSSGAFTNLGTATVPGAFFSFDAAGINPQIGTRSFSGIFATSRNATVRPTFAFTGFSVTAASTTPPPPPPPAGSIIFDRVSHALSKPTSVVQGPDGKLYVATLFGEVHVLTLDANGNVTNDQTVTSLGSRLALGIAIDPASTPSNVIVWVAHSSPAVLAGIANTGTVTRLSGAGLTTKADVITGLPRSISNHSVNSLHFGADGKLYIAVGGNTGAGAPNTANTEFGPLAEQPLSAALVVADVNKVASATFDGTCDNGSDIYSPNPCDVTVWASGLRNTYDFAFHSNGHMYGTDNGLGVVGSYPPSPTAPCFGFGDTTSWTTGGNNPGGQPDELNLIEQGKYYGHPNPTRNECVFGDGTWQKVNAAPNYTAPVTSLGMNRSANGIIEYTGDAFCGALKGNLLIANYSTGKDITRVVLSADGRSVTSRTSLTGGFLDPLPIGLTSQGWVVVGEFGGDKITVLKPRETGCYGAGTALPVSRLDAGGAAIGDTMYVVGGKDSAGAQNTLHAYDSVTKTWSARAPKPGTAVENPSVVAWNGKLYVVGGSDAPFSGAVSEGWVYTPGTNSWAVLPSLGTARGGAGAALVGSTMYVVGGLGTNGASLASVERIDLANPTGWASAPSLATARDNPGVAAIGTTVFAFGGRTRLADGTTVAGTLASSEALASGAVSWTSRAAMPTGRRTTAVQVVNGRAYVIGGEITTTGGAFTQNESYDPVADTWRAETAMSPGRHGMAAGVIGDRIYLVGGGTTGGSSFSALTTIFAPPA